MSTRKILLVENDLTRRLRLGNAIVRRRWRLQTARTGDEAVGLLHWFEPAVIVLDLDMQGGFSEDLVARLRGAPLAADATIVGMIDRDRDAESVGVDTLLTRPFSLEAMFDAIDHMCERRARLVESAVAADRR